MHLHGILWLSLSALGGCTDSGGPTQQSVPIDSDGGEGDGDSQDALVCDTVLPTSCPTPVVTYQRDVKPIIEARCLSCHDGNGKEWPLTDYAHVADWVGEVRAVIADCSMPPPEEDIEMPTSERQVLLDWVRCGAPE